MAFEIISVLRHSHSMQDRAADTTESEGFNQVIDQKNKKAPPPPKDSLEEKIRSYVDFYLKKYNLVIGSDVTQDQYNQVIQEVKNVIDGIQQSKNFKKLSAKEQENMQSLLVETATIVWTNLKAGPNDKNFKELKDAIGCELSPLISREHHALMLQMLNDLADDKVGLIGLYDKSRNHDIIQQFAAMHGDFGRKMETSFKEISSFPVASDVETHIQAFSRPHDQASYVTTYDPKLEYIYVNDGSWVTGPEDCNDVASLLSEYAFAKANQENLQNKDYQNSFFGSLKKHQNLVGAQTAVALYKKDRTFADFHYGTEYQAACRGIVTKGLWGYDLSEGSYAWTTQLLNEGQVNRIQQALDELFNPETGHAYLVPPQTLMQDLKNLSQ